MHAALFALALLAQAPDDLPPPGLAYPAPRPEAATKADLEVLQAALEGRLRAQDRRIADLADQLRTMRVVDAIVPGARVTATATTTAAAPSPLARRADARGQVWEHADARFLETWVAQRNATMAAPAVSAFYGSFMPGAAVPMGGGYSVPGFSGSACQPGMACYGRFQ